MSGLESERVAVDQIHRFDPFVDIWIFLQFRKTIIRSSNNECRVLAVCRSRYRLIILSLPDRNVLTYICGYLIKKIKYLKNSCGFWIKYSRFYKNLDQPFSYFKAHANKENSIFGNLLMLHIDFYNYIHILETFFINIFTAQITENNVDEKLK